MLPTHDVDCPKCGKMLYSSLSLEDVAATGTPTSPKVETDARGDFMRCPYCSARIAMKRITTDAGTGFRVANEASK